jgi:4-hydroxybenzoate polyprenyltransferase/phosphoserine phosphatase
MNQLACQQVSQVDEIMKTCLVVDLDNTLIKTDLLHEAIISALKNSPYLLFVALGSLFKGRAAFKKALTCSVIPDARHLPFRDEVLDFLAKERAQGRKIILATASDHAWACQIADELGLFDDVLASDGEQNLKGETKLHVIRSYCQQHDYVCFDYVGDSDADIPIWRNARLSYLVAPSPVLLRKVQRFTDTATVLGKRNSPFSAIIKSLRPHQWIKNSLVFIPLLASHKIFIMQNILAVLLAFLCFSVSASAVYILNDLLDIDADRRHPKKRKRPFADGSLPVIWGPLLAAALIFLGFSVSFLTLPIGFSVALLTYFLLTCAYSLRLKRIVMLDVITLSLLYIIRVIAGGYATGISVSTWLLAFSLFLFVSLAFAKRHAELGRLEQAGEKVVSGRSYIVSDLSIIESFGSSSGYLSVLVLALYINGEEMKLLYSRPWALWVICPLLMYWISRLWLKAKRSELSEDPVIFALRDRGSIVIGVLTALLLIAAT